MSKRLVYGIEIDTSDAANSVRRIQEALRTLEQDTTSSQREINGLTQELKELGATTGGVATETNKATDSVNDLQKAFDDLMKKAQTLDQSSEEFRKVTQEAGVLKNRIDDTNTSINNLSGAPVSNLSNSFASLTSNIVTLNMEGVVRSFGDLKTAMVSVITQTLGITAGMNGAAVAARVLRGALIATGVGAFAVAVGTLIANFDTLKVSGGVLGNTLKVIGDTAGVVTLNVLKLSDAIGLTSNAVDEYNKKKLGDVAESATVKRMEEIGNKVASLRKELHGVSVDDIFNEGKMNIQEMRNVLNDMRDENRELKRELKREVGKQLDTLNQIAEKYRHSDSATVLQMLSDTREKIANYVTEIKESNKLLDLLEEYVRLNDEMVKTRSEDIMIAETSKVFEDKLKLERLELLQHLAQKKITQEEFEEEMLRAEQDFFGSRIELMSSYNRDTIDDNIGFTEKTLELIALRENREKEAGEELSDIYDEVARLRKKTMNSQINLVDVMINRAKQLSDDEHHNHLLSIDLANKRLGILEANNITEGELYEEAIFQKMLAEKQLDDYKEELSRKDQEREKEELEASKAAYKEKLSQGQNLLSFTSNQLGVISGMVSQRYENERAMAIGNQEKLNEIAEEQFKVNKGFALVSTAINTAQAVMQVWANAPNPIAGGILSGVVAALGVAQMAVIASQQFTPQSAGSSSGSISSPSVPQPSNTGPNINFTGAGAGGNITTAGGGTPESIQFTGSISVSEINDVQNLIDVYEGGLLGGG